MDKTKDSTFIIAYGLQKIRSLIFDETRKVVLTSEDEKWISSHFFFLA